MISPLPPCGRGAGGEGFLSSPALGEGLGVRAFSPRPLWERGRGRGPAPLSRRRTKVPSLLSLIPNPSP